MLRQVDRLPGEDVFEQVGISAEDASRIAEQLISHVALLEEEERRAEEELGESAGVAEEPGAAEE